MNKRPSSSPSHSSSSRQVKKIAIIGAGMAGITAARTLAQAGHDVTVFEKSQGVSGRMSTRHSDVGSFDHGAQYFTVRDARFRLMMQWALNDAPDIARPWGANAVRVLDSQGRTLEAALPAREPHWVAQPGMNALVAHMAAPLLAAGRIRLSCLVSAVLRQGDHYSVQSTDAKKDKAPVQNHAGFDHVLLAIPSVQAQALLAQSALAHSSKVSSLSKTKQTIEQIPGRMADFAQKISEVTVAPCWTLMLAFPNTVPVSATQVARPLGPQWNAARSTHHRIAWLSRESSKPARGGIERWTVQASADWSREHLEDSTERVQAKLLKAFAEITGIRAEPVYAQAHRWRYAKTEQALGTSHLWSAADGLGVCGDWCLGHRVEDAFVSGLELALKVCAQA
jgi:renalase